MPTSQFTELDDGSLQCNHCPYVQPIFHVRMILSRHQTSFSEDRFVDPQIPPFHDFMLQSSDDKYFIPFLPQHVISSGKPDATTQTKMLNYANLCIRKALLLQQDMHQKFLQAELS